MEAAAFVAMIVLLLLIFSHCNCHLLEESQVATEKEATDEPKIALIQTEQIKSHDDITPKIPIEFEGRNPCVDWILVRQKYPGSDCHFYQCELHQPVKPACRLQVIDEESFPIINPKTVIEKSILVRITSCLSIRIFKCVYGYKYSNESKGCVKCINNYSKFICSS